LKEENLCLSFSQLRLNGDTTPCHLSTILSEIHNKGFQKILCIVDSCHSGASARAIETALPRNQYCALFAASNSYAQFSSSGGIFTRELALALSYGTIRANTEPPLRDPMTRAITFRTCFEYVEGKLRDRHVSQQPMLAGDLDAVLVAGDLKVSPPLNVRAPLKSLYRKLYAVLSLLGNRTMSESAFYEQVTTLQPIELTVADLERGRPSQKPVSEGKFYEYLDTAESLGFITEASGTTRRRKLTDIGRAASEDEGAKYNEILVERVAEMLKESGLTVASLREHLFHLAEKGRLPNLENLLARFLEEKQITPNKNTLRLTLRLLGYSGLLKKATSDTYFP
jgi:DNA-binding PadR family transcriptional regulator